MLRLCFFLSFCLSTFTIQQLSACCPGEPYTTVELLNKMDEPRSIFLCTIDSIDTKNRHLIFATVDEVFKDKKVQTQVMINTYRSGIEKGQQLLIISQSKDGFEFSAFGCDMLSQYLNTDNERGHSTLAMIRQYTQWQKEKYTGPVDIKVQDMVLSQGQLLNGKAQGTWTFFSYNNKKIQRVYKIVQYEDGLLDGTSSSYHTYPSQINFRQHFKKGALVSQEHFAPSKEVWHKSANIEYTLKTDGVKRQKSTFYYPSGQVNRVFYEVWEQKEQKEQNYAYGEYYGRKHMDGIFQSFSKNGTLLESGHYLHGKKIGKWISYTSKGTVRKEEIHSKHQVSGQP